jgi:hypothetical protein
LAKPTILTLDNIAAVLDLSQASYVTLVGERVADLANVTAGTRTESSLRRRAGISWSILLAVAGALLRCSSSP